MAARAKKENKIAKTGRKARKAVPATELKVEGVVAEPKAPARKRVAFSVSAEPGSKVAVSGDFNNWDAAGRPMEDKKGDGNYSVTILLAPGVYEYKFIVNDTWSIDPNCAEWVQNSFGTLNSVIRV